MGTLLGKIFLYSSSSVMTVSPLRGSLSVTGAISALKAPAAHAFAALSYEASAYLSWSSRVMLCLEAVSSALFVMSQLAPQFKLDPSSEVALTRVPWVHRCRRPEVRL